MGSVTVPPDTIEEIECPTASEIDAPESERGIEFAADVATRILKDAKVPLETTVEFIPATRQVIDPGEFTQLSDLPAATRLSRPQGCTD